nr:type II toxin-antitoxin system RelE/ParE family toxin [Paenalcaligenes niemegkensis]
MVFIETPTFTKQITTLLADDEYRSLLNELVENSSKGPIISGGGGIRKLSFARSGTEKSGGVRVIYYWVAADHQIYMLVAYPKSKKDTLTKVELAVLHDLVKEL